MIKSGRDFHKPYSIYKLQDIDDQFPEYLRENQEIFSEFILKK